jgi:D-glycero-alpha-D-manno-heptose-7-phosphate kinase
MIITRSPLRLSLGGGGTDLASYYSRFGGFLIAAAMDKYIYITLHKTFDNKLIIKYSKMETANSREEINHPIIRESLKFLDIRDTNLEISSIANIPAGTGLGSSGSFTTALLKAFHAHKKSIVHPRDIAEQACHIEIDILKEPIGKQDQYIAAYGGITCFTFDKDGKVHAEPLNISNETLYNLEDNLLLFFTGYSRKASSILKEQDEKSKGEDKSMIDNLHFVKDIGLRTKKVLEDGDVEAFGKLMNEHWEHKKKRSSSMSNQDINAWYDLAMKNGAIGGKLIGAGGGGFLMFYANDKPKLRHTMLKAGLKEVRFKFDFEGTKVFLQYE